MFLLEKPIRKANEAIERMASESKQSIGFSHVDLRNFVGMAAILIPILLFFGGLLWPKCPIVESSISAYFGTELRGIFVGLLLAISFFFFAYGYKKWDSKLTNGTAILSLMIALFPSTSKESWIQLVHNLSAITFFGIMAYFCLVLFKKNKGKKTEKKIRRNRVYTRCGWIILVCVVLLIGNYFLCIWGGIDLSDYKVTLILESIALWAFGLSWLVKSETISWLLADND